ncbi:hypothetical protein HZA76_02400 [Candidatus Roizmanbacteria bacterium]|nr:hypothetical protein [Candidatus Roizmanbacteria bacterium]
MAEAKAAKPFILPKERSHQYIKWIDQIADRLKERLPFNGPFDSFITLGSGMEGALDAFQLSNPEEINFSDIGLPEGSNPAHHKKIVVGTTPQGKKVGISVGRTSAMEVPVNGVMTDEGSLEQMEVASAALSVVEKIGAENVILCTASGGFNHPMRRKGKKPFNKDRLPIIGVIGADISWGYNMEHMGHYQASKGHFFALQDGDQNLNDAFIKSMAEVSPGTEVPSLYYASIPAAFEDPGLAHLLIINNVQAIGMSYGPEKVHLSGANNSGNKGDSNRIGKFMGITVITDRVELYDPKNPNRKSPISVEELRFRYPQEFEILEPSLDPEVRAMAAKANDKLGKALVNMIEKI